MPMEKEDRIDIEKTHMRATLLLWLQIEHPEIFSAKYLEAFERLWEKLRKQNGIRK